MNRPSRRLVIGMLNTAGQARQWANAVRQNTATTAESWAMQRPEGTAISYTADRIYPQIDGAINQARSDLLRAPLKPTHLLIESGKPISVRGSVRRMLFEAVIARRHGIRLALVFHGSDIRVPSQHAATHQDSPFHMSLDGLTEKLEQKTRQMHRWLRVWPFPIFVTTIGLKHFVPRAKWLPIIADDSWFTPMLPITTERPRPHVLHVASRRSILQSDRVDQICQKLHDEGLIEYRSISGVAPSEVRAHVEWSDIVMDRIGTGGTGVFGAEVMASGRLLIGDVDQIVRDELPDLPLIQSSFRTLEQVFRDLVADRSTWAARAAAGEAFARKYHDGRHSAAVLAEWMGIPVNQP
ncbi:MAG: hypothetical protein EBX81_03680 [bacterium]|nr:hypothetical protein [Candidatus Aquidulcis sp.]